MSLKKYIPLLVGWYAILSVLDAMFWSMTGLTFFVGDTTLRFFLTLIDAGAAIVAFGIQRGEFG